MSTLALDIVLQNHKKVLTLRDITPDIPGVIGWTEWGGFDNFFDSNVNANYRITITVTIQSKISTDVVTFSMDAASQEDFAGLVTVGNTEVDDQNDIYYNLALVNGQLTPIGRNAVENLDEYETFPDGIYNVTYTVSNSVLAEPIDEEIDENYVVSDSADLVMLGKTDDVQDKMFVCPNWDLEASLDYLVYSTMHATLGHSRLVSRTETILNTLNHINNEDYEYFTD